MSTRLKVPGGTRSFGAPRLCDTCQTGVVRRDAPDSDEEIFCTITQHRLARAVVECNRYVDRSPLLRIPGGQLVKQRRRLGDVVDPEDHQGQRRSRLQSAIGIVDIDLFLAQTGGRAAQLARTMR
jgi:hypothetical protein